MYTLTRQHFSNTLDTYCDAWRNKNSELILTIFDREAIYHERVLDEPVLGHDGIRKYWLNKVVTGQRNISITVNRLYIDGNVGIAEWHVNFEDLEKKKLKAMKEIVVMEFLESGKIGILREYWASKVLGNLD